MLVWIMINLILPQDEDDMRKFTPPDNQWRAVRTLVVVADLIMSLDNVIAIAAAAKGDSS